MKKKLQKVIGVLSIMKDFNMKPNFSELEPLMNITDGQAHPIR